jgi:hypothetical protein
VAIDSGDRTGLIFPLAGPRSAAGPFLAAIAARPAPPGLPLLRCHGTVTAAALFTWLCS